MVESEKGRQGAKIHSRTGPFHTSPRVKGCDSVAVKMHNTLAESVVSTEKIPPNALSMDRLVLRLRLCILIAYNILVP